MAGPNVSPPRDRRPLLYLAPNRWNGLRQRTQHVAAGLARTRPVVFVEPAAYSVPGVFRRRLSGDPAGVQPDGPKAAGANLTVYAPPPGLPWSLQSRSMNRLVHYFAWVNLRRALGRLESVDVLIAWPPALDLARRLRPRRLIYDCMDLLPAFDRGLRRRLMEALEDDLARDASAVVVTSRSLERRWARRHPRVLRIPNGVEWPIFRTAAESQPVPPDLAGIPPRRLGYAGTVGPWLDLPLLVYVARQLPDCSIVLVGPTERGVARPPDVPNLYFVGERPYSSLPAYLAAMDVLLVPFRLTDLTHAVNPIKFYEYCASGKPMAATPLEELVPFGDVCHLGEGPAAFLSAVKTALDEAGRPERARVVARQQIALANTWDARVAAFMSLLDESDMDSPEKLR